MNRVFNNKIQYQFIVFYADQSSVSNKIDNLRETISKKHQSNDLSIKLGSPINQQQALLQGNQATAVTTTVWTSNMWSMIWSPIRLDIFCNPLVYAEFNDTLLSFSDISKRISKNIQEAIAYLDIPVNRLAAVLNADGIVEDTENLTKSISRKYYNKEICDSVEAEEISDLGVRINRPFKWMPDTPISAIEDGIPLNRIESVGSNWSFRGKEPIATVNLQLDANTSPSLGTSVWFKGSVVEEFFSYASGWIDEVSGDISDVMNTKARAVG